MHFAADVASCDHEPPRLKRERQAGNWRQTKSRYKSIDLVGFFSGILSAASVLGTATLTLGPWGDQVSGRTAYTLLTLSSARIRVVCMLASNLAKILQAQADQIAALQGQFAEQRSRA